ncbi:methanogenic corrinoid protein MtbC1 [Rhodoblastus acidophilus]|uniref:cobalamin B12-binding domain-containing protein n=1 Tax=Rhodoblastus acidophilus TaxID=1074 RepID=UPI00160A4C53|nr:cobalamin B12-binding domain-containing protein [Rhodoblastus acidophilus]MCW2282295.1 methanogenic corrinoid protein MtbC1 [Rhodoblastus acidophilus]MCW2331300.1 methanogenic corrinoid protein MtbC1 [Rhodoblastus acidophilus]
MYQPGAFPVSIASDVTGAGPTTLRRSVRGKAGNGLICLESRLGRGNRPAPSCDELTALARLLATGRDDAFRAEIYGRLAGGGPLSVMMDILAPVAREIGCFWDNDESDLIDVQRATGVLKRLIDEIALRVTAQTLAKPPSILLQAAPGERHTLGVQMAESVFCGMGWRVARSEARGFRAELAHEWRDFLGFSLSCDRHLDALAQAIAEARAVSRNPKLLVVVGGAFFGRRPDIARQIGADFCVCGTEMPVQPQDALLNGPRRHTFFTRAAELGFGQPEQE